MKIFENGNILDDLHMTTKLVDVKDTVITNSTLNDTEATGLVYNSKRIPMHSLSYHNGSSAQTVEIPLSLKSYNFTLFEISIYANTYNGGGLSVASVHNVIVSAKVNGTNDWTLFSDELRTPTGFTSDPAFTVSDTSDGNGTLTISFTMDDASRTGFCSMKEIPNIRL